MQTNTTTPRIYVARLVTTKAGILVYLKSPSGDENYLGNDGSFSGNVNSERYARHFDSAICARQETQDFFNSIYPNPVYSKMEWSKD